MTGRAVVRAFEPGDADALLALHRDCLRHYGCGPAPAEVERELLCELAAPWGTKAWLAWRGAEPMGFAFALRVPAGPGFALYLKELCVAAGARGAGAGRALMRALAERAVATSARRLQWETGEQDARVFYARLGARTSGKAHYVVEGAALRSFAL